MTRTLPWFPAAVILAMLGQLVVGVYYLASGLMAPLWAVVALCAWWVALTLAGMWLVRRRSYLVLLVPVVAVVSWFGVMTLGGSVLGWTP